MPFFLDKPCRGYTKPKQLTPSGVGIDQSRMKRSKTTLRIPTGHNMKDAYKGGLPHKIIPCKLAERQSSP